MREINLAQSAAKRKLLESAELLFAERGFEAVSVREIIRHAETNVAAINYHFGSRDSLIGLVVSRYLTPVNEERLARLETLERKWSGKAVPVEEVIDAMVRPLVGVVRKAALPERLCARLLGLIFALRGENLPAAIEEQARQVSERFTRMLGKSLVTVTPEELVWRQHFVTGALIHLLVNQDVLEQLSHGVSGAPAMEATLSRFIRFATAGLREGVEADPAAVVKKGPQAMFDF
jgi:AcrR family transcriptional regulator